MMFVFYVGCFVELNWFPSCCCFTTEFNCIPYILKEVWISFYASEFDRFGSSMYLARTDENCIATCRPFDSVEMLVKDERPRVGGYRTRRSLGTLGRGPGW